MSIRLKMTKLNENKFGVKAFLDLSWLDGWLHTKMTNVSLHYFEYMSIYNLY